MQKLRPRVEILSYGVDGVDSAPTQFFLNFWNCPKRVELGCSLLRLQVNIDKANSRRYDVTRLMVYRGPGKIRNPHISVLYIFGEVKFKFNGMSMLSRSGLLIS